MILNEENVMTIVDGAVIMVLNPATDMYVECRVGEMFEGIYLTTTDSDVAAGNAPGGNYRDHVHHLRANDSYAAVMSREAMAQLLVNGQYTIK